MSKLQPFWIKVVQLTIPIYIVGFLLLGIVATHYFNSKIKADAQQQVDFLALDKKNQLQHLLNSFKHEASIIVKTNFDDKQNFGIANSFKLTEKLLICNILKNGYSSLIICNGLSDIILKLDEEDNLTITYANKSSKISKYIKNTPTPSLLIDFNAPDSSIKSIRAIVHIGNSENTVCCLEYAYKNLIDAVSTKSDSANWITTSLLRSASKKNNKNTISQQRQINIDEEVLYITVEKNIEEQLASVKKFGFQLMLIGFGLLVAILLAFSLVVKKIIEPLELLKQSIENAEISNSQSFKTYNGNNIVGWLSNTYSKLTMQIKHTSSQLDERDERLNHFYLATTDGIYIHHSGTPLIFNPALRNLTGFTEQELQKLRPSDFLIIDEDILQAAHEQRYSIFEAELKTKHGTRLQVEVQMNEIIYRGQKAESLVIRDITHRKSMEQELQQERKRQVKSVIDGQEKERQRLSRELHDGLGQNLVAIKLKLESISPEQAGALDGTLNQVKHMFSHTIEEIRRISNNLMPAALKEFSLAVVLRNLCNEIESNSSISIGLTIGVLPESLDQILKTYVYRIVQEALTNVVKHSGASKTLISVFSDFSNLHLQIEDNGVGFNTTILSDSGNGLYNMKERAILLGGKINIISSKGKGVKIVAEFPLNQSNTQQYD